MLLTDIAGTSLTSTEQEWLQHTYLSGIILFARNVTSPEQVAELCAAIRSCNPNLLITVDQEGGRVMRLKSGFVALPPLATLGQQYRHSPQEANQLAFSHGWLMANDVLSVGIDLSFAPVLDVNHGMSSVIGDRAFAQEIQTIIELATSYMQGMRAAGMQTVGKHFPGHGGVAADTHTDTATDTRNKAVLLAEDASVFRAFVDSGFLTAVMTAHVCYPAVDNRVVTFSSTWLTEILKREWGYRGVVISDDLTMHAATTQGDITQRAHAALTAGCELLLVCNHAQDAQSVLDWCMRQAPIALSASRSAAARLKGKWHTYTSREQMQQCAIWHTRCADLTRLDAYR